YRVIFVAVVLLGATSRLEVVWNVSDVMNGLMAIPNLIGLLLLAKIIKQETGRYFNHRPVLKRIPATKSD
ncbi:MAG: alanine:cation symporter family protein, partial [Nitrospira sp.]|nr:alanine:cation symporter family protein [Nitrospira sp.]